MPKHTTCPHEESIQQQGQDGTIEARQLIVLPGVKSKGTGHEMIVTTASETVTQSRFKSIGIQRTRKVSSEVYAHGHITKPQHLPCTVARLDVTRREKLGG